MKIDIKKRQQNKCPDNYETVLNIFFSHRRVDLYENGQWLDNLIEHPRKSDIPL